MSWIVKKNVRQIWISWSQKISLFSPSPLPIIILFSIMESTALNKRHYHTWVSTEEHNKVYFGWLYSSDYKQRLHNLQLLPLMYILDFYTLFFVESLKQPSNHFNILNYATFSKNRKRSATNNKLLHNYSSNNKIRNSYFNCLPIDCGIVSLLLTKICTSIQSRH